MLYLAPLQGLTDLPFRIAFAQTFGNVFDFAVSPFISLTHGDNVSNLKKLSDVLPQNNINAIPLIPQILGNNPEHFSAIAQTLWEMGYEEINWNLGCPVKRVTGKKRGSGLLPYPEIIDSFLDYACNHVKQDISLKIRLGFQSPDDIFQLIPVFNKYPLKSITIHPRIGIQMYEGELHWKIFQECVSLINHPVIFNGDIRNKNDIEYLQTHFPDIKDYMIGRGVLINPLLAGQIKNISYPSPNQKLEEFFLNLLFQLKEHKKTDRAVLNKTKEFWSYLALSFYNPEHMLNKIQIIDNLQDLESISVECINNELLKE